jgi:hypothetical protein
MSENTRLRELALLDIVDATLNNKLCWAELDVYRKRISELEAALRASQDALEKASGDYAIQYGPPKEVIVISGLPHMCSSSPCKAHIVYRIAPVDFESIAR